MPLFDMSTLATDTNTEDSDLYTKLGLQESKKENRGSPPVLSLVSSFLERCVQKNEVLLKSAQISDVITVFHGSRAPSLGIRQYIDRIFKYSCCSPSCFVVANIFVEKFIQRMNIYVTSLNVHRLLITSVMVAAKFIDDAFFSNAYYAKVGGVTTRELNNLEVKFLFGLDFRLYLSVPTFRKYCFKLEKEAAVAVFVPIERPILACGIKQSWSSADDATCTSTIAR